MANFTSILINYRTAVSEKEGRVKEGSVLATATAAATGYDYGTSLEMSDKITAFFEAQRMEEVTWGYGSCAGLLPEFLPGPQP